MRFFALASVLLLSSCLTTTHFNSFPPGTELTETAVFSQKNFTKNTKLSPAQFVAPALPASDGLVLSTSDFGLTLAGGAGSQIFAPVPQLAVVWKGTLAFDGQTHDLRVDLLVSGFRISGQWAAVARPEVLSVKLTLDGNEWKDVSPQREPLKYPYEFLRSGTGFLRRDDINTFPWVSPSDKNSGHDSYQLVRYGLEGFSYHQGDSMLAQYDGKTVRTPGALTLETAALVATGIVITQTLVAVQE